MEGIRILFFYPLDPDKTPSAPAPIIARAPCCSISRIPASCATARYRSRDWILQPEEWYELEGFYKGVCFPCGKVVIDGTLFVYYGGADKYVGLATCPLQELLDYLLAALLMGCVEIDALRGTRKKDCVSLRGALFATKQSQRATGRRLLRREASSQ